MKLIIGISLALLIAWLWNQTWLRLGLKEQFRVGFLAPFGEEIIKYVVAISLSLPLPLFYACFGLGEGIYETFSIYHIWVSSLVLAGIIVHLSLSFFLLLPFAWWIQLSLAILSHIVWNNFVLTMNKHKRT